MKFNFPLMVNNIDRKDLDQVIDFLKNDNPILTQSKNVEFFEDEWSSWLGCKYSVFVNSGSSANLITIAALKEISGVGEIIVPTFTWISDIVSVIQNGFTPIFVDINPNNLCMDESKILDKINSNTKAVFITYAQGFNGLTDKLINTLKEKSIPLIEDVCESHGARFKNKKLGSYGLMSNFSFYYAHHMSTIEGGMVCTNDKNVYQILKMLRSHGMIRESKDNNLINKYIEDNPSLNPKFIFAHSGYNVRNTEIGAVIGRSQLKRLDQNIDKRNKNHKIFLENINQNKFKVNFDLDGSSNYAFNLILKNPDNNLVKNLMNKMDSYKIEYRRGSVGGGNQLRQPYLKKLIKNKYWLEFPEVEHIHFYGFYLGNYPSLNENKILELCEIINAV